MIKKEEKLEKENKVYNMNYIKHYNLGDTYTSLT
jgi:hypothetical protein